MDLWSIRAAGRIWTGQIRCIGEVHGGAWEFVLRRDNDLTYSRRFVTHGAAMHEAAEQRQMVERTWARAEVLVDCQR